MLTIAEIVRSTYGVWRLAHVDPGGMSYFDATPDGFWRSFRVAILLLPLQFVSIALQLGMTSTEASLARVLAVDLIAYAISWIAFPLAAHYLALALDREREYVGYIVAFNWASMLVLPFQIVVLGITASGLLPGLLLTLVIIVMWGALLAYSWFIAKVALRIDGLPAAGFVAIEVVILILITIVASSMIN